MRPDALSPGFDHPDFVLEGGGGFGGGGGGWQAAHSISSLKEAGALAVKVVEPATDMRGKRGHASLVERPRESQSTTSDRKETAKPIVGGLTDPSRALDNKRAGEPSADPMPVPRTYILF